MKLNELLRNPALIIGLVRAIILFATVYGIKLSQEQQDATLNLVAVVVPLISLAFTGVTIAKTQPSPVPVNEAKLSPPE